MAPITGKVFVPPRTPHDPHHHTRPHLSSLSRVFRHKLLLLNQTSGNPNSNGDLYRCAVSAGSFATVLPTPSLTSQQATRVSFSLSSANQLDCCQVPTCCQISFASTHPRKPKSHSHLQTKNPRKPKYRKVFTMKKTATETFSMKKICEKGYWLHLEFHSRSKFIETYLAERRTCHTNVPRCPL